jgi:hypothetical protein
MKPESTPEKIIWYTLLWTYGFFWIGGLYVVGSVVGWILFGCWVKQLWQQTDATAEGDRIHIPWTIWVWLAGMGMMQVSLVIGHLDFDLSTALIIKSSIGWAKGWALLAILPLVGTFKIRPQLLYRIACMIGGQTLLIFPIFLLAYVLHLPETPYVSPLKVFGPGPEFSAPSLYEIDPSNGQPRWRLFTPWAPALGVMGNFYFVLAMQERDRKWKLLGIIGAIFMCVISVSRLALLAMPVVMVLTQVLSRLSRPLVLMLTGVVSLISSLMSPMILTALETFTDKFRSARADSSRVREALGRIALERWGNEAPVWGHGVVEEGPHLVEYMPIGSHHTWFGLLFVKGMVGLFALAIPLVCSLIDLVVRSQWSQTAKVGLSILWILFLYTFGENLEVLAYLYWPALIMLGIALSEPIPGAFPQSPREDDAEVKCT